MTAKLPAPCQEPGCDRPAIARGRCRRHYLAWRDSPAFAFAYHTHAGTPADPAVPKRLECTAPGCDRPATRRGLCAMHYARRYRRQHWAEYQRQHRARLKAEEEAQHAEEP